MNTMNRSLLVVEHSLVTEAAGQKVTVWIKQGPNWAGISA